MTPTPTAAVHEAIDLLDRGEARVAEVDPEGDVIVHEWLKQAILLLFRLSAMETIEVGPFEYADKLPLKRGFAEAGVRVVPGASARWGCFLEPGVILMPSYVNIGARVGADTMVDTWATVGSCAQIGANVHLSGGVGIGGVLEPPQAAPVIVEDDALIGSRCMITQGARVGRGAVLGEGCILNRGIPVIDAETGEELSRGVVPPWCVAVDRHPAPPLPRRRVRPALRAGHPPARRGRAPRQGPAQRDPPRARRLGVTADLLAGDRRAGRHPSVSHHEAAIADHVEARLRAVAWLDGRPGRRQRGGPHHLGRPSRLILAGHIDTVPANGNDAPRSRATRCGVSARPT